jgi:hypothetical protein
VIEWLIRRVLAMLAGITVAQWETALDLVQQASRHLTDKTGLERKQYVIDNSYPQSTLSISTSMQQQSAKRPTPSPTISPHVRASTKMSGRSCCNKKIERKLRAQQEIRPSAYHYSI